MTELFDERMSELIGLLALPCAARKNETLDRIVELMQPVGSLAKTSESVQKAVCRR